MALAYIYRIQHDDSDLCYIGSTKQPLRERWRIHQVHYKLWKLGKFNKISIFPFFDKFGIDNFTMILEKTCTFVNRRNQRVNEMFCMYKFRKSCCNIKSPVANPMVKYLRKLYHAAHYKRNHMAIREKCKLYAMENKERFREHYREYRKRNKETISKRGCAWYRQNKEAILAKMKVIIICECGASTTQGSIVAHRKRQSHKARMENKEKVIPPKRVVCECGIEVARTGLNGHRKSQKHQDAMENNEVKVVERVVCECGASVAPHCMSRHVKSKKHHEAMGNSEALVARITCKCGAIIAKGGSYKHEATAKHREMMASLTT